MNVQNLERVAEWLEAGAPHVVFDMKIGIADLRNDGSIEEASVYDTAEEYLDAKGVTNNTCNTVCCIAGAALMLAEADPVTGWPSLSTETGIQKINGWIGVQETAARWLGISSYDLFSFELAPSSCTPAQAAVAVRNVMSGKEPWDVKDT
jgi:hypothetical protein